MWMFACGVLCCIRTRILSNCLVFLILLTDSNAIMARNCSHKPAVVYYRIDSYFQVFLKQLKAILAYIERASGQLSLLFTQ